MLKYIFILIIFFSSTNAFANVFEKINKDYPLSRLEYSAKRITDELNQKVFERYSNNQFYKYEDKNCSTRLVELKNGKYKKINEKRLIFYCFIEIDYNTTKWDNNKSAFVEVLTKKEVLESIKKRDLSAFSDNISKEMFHYFNHFGEYDSKNIHGDNIMFIRLHELFLDFWSEGKLKRTNINTINDLSKKIFFMVHVSINGRGYNRQKKYIYPLVQIFSKKKYEKDLLMNFSYPNEDTFK
jgi:hypothetical protein